jgi:hypothetical protein
VQLVFEKFLELAPEPETIAQAEFTGALEIAYAIT